MSEAGRESSRAKEVATCWLFFNHVVPWIAGNLDALLNLSEVSILLRAKCVHTAIKEHGKAEVFERATKLRCAETVVWVADNIEGSRFPEWRIREAFRDQARRFSAVGHLDGLKRVEARHVIDQSDLRSYNNSCLVNAALGRHYDVIAWLKARLEREDLLIAFQALLRLGGKIDVASLLALVAAATREDIRRLDLMRVLLRDGLLEEAKWLSERFELTRDDVTARSNAIFRLACSNGCTDTVIWVFERFKLTPEDARSCSNFALRGAAAGGHEAIVRFLVEHAGLDGVDDIGLAVDAAKGGAHEKLAKWLSVKLS